MRLPAKSAAKIGERVVHFVVAPDVGRHEIRVPGFEYFILVTVIDAAQANDRKSVKAFIESALASGARSIVSAGETAEELESLFDSEIIASGLEGDADSVITTISEGREPLDEVLWDSIYVASLGARWQENDKSAVVFVFIEGDPRIKEFEAMAVDLESTLRRVEDRTP